MRRTSMLPAWHALDRALDAVARLAIIAGISKQELEYRLRGSLVSAAAAADLSKPWLAKRLDVRKRTVQFWQAKSPEYTNARLWQIQLAIAKRIRGGPDSLELGDLESDEEYGARFREAFDLLERFGFIDDSEELGPSAALIRTFNDACADLQCAAATMPYINRNTTVRQKSKAPRRRKARSK